MNIHHFFSPLGTYFQKLRGVSDEELQHFQTARGLRLPESFVEVLRIQNGGMLRFSEFVDAEGDARTFRELGGIGPERFATINLLGLCSGDTLETQHDSDHVPLSWENDTLLALDYSECGPTGEPQVAAFDCLEPPVIKSVVAATFGEFLAGLQRRESRYVLGLVDAEPLIPKIISLMTQRIGEPTRSNDAYEFKHADWRTSSGRVELCPNVDQATHYDNQTGTLHSRPAGLLYPEADDCPWLLKVPTADEVQDLMAELIPQFETPPVLLHEPYDASVYAPDLENNPESTHETEDYTFELPAGFGFLGILRQMKAPGEGITTVLGEHLQVQVDYGTLKVGGVGFGKVNRGDRIRVVDKHHVLVNGERRESAT